MISLTKSQLKALQNSGENLRLAERINDSGYKIVKDTVKPENHGDVRIYREARNNTGDLISLSMIITPRGKIFNSRYSKIDSETVKDLERP